MLKAACERNVGIVEVDKQLKADSSDENMKVSIAALFGKSMFHNAKATNEEGINDELECTEFELGQQSDSDI